MPPKVTDTRTAQNEALHKVEEQTAAGARSIVASYSEDFHDCVTLMCMLGIEPDGLDYKKVHAEWLEEHEAKPAKRSRKAAKKTTRKSAKKAATKAAKKTTAKKTAKKAAKRTTAKASAPASDAADGATGGKA